MRPTRAFSASVSLLALLASVATASPEDGPAKPPPPPAPAGPTYKNANLGFTMEGPSGWRMTEEGTGASSWVPLVKFIDPSSGGSSVLAVRRASAVKLAKLREEVTRSFADDKSFTVAAITDLPPTGRRPLPGILVDATLLRPGDPPPAGTAAPPGPPPSVTWRVLAAYLLGGDHEYLLYSQVKATLFSRFQPQLERALESVTVKLAGSAFGPKGEGAFRDDAAGFSCRYPAGYGVRLPERTLHLVEFAPAGDGPVLGVYRYESEGDLDHEAKTLVDYYTGAEVGGEATAGTREVAGRSAALVTAKGRVGGRDQVFFVAVVKRGSDTFRLRVAADVAQESAARATFDQFAKSFALTN